MTDAPAMAGSGTRSSAAFYADSLDAFLRASDDEVYAPLTSPHGYTLAPEQLSAWRLQLPVLRAALASEKGASHHFRDVDGDGEADGENGGRHLFAGALAPWLHLEFDIPRLGRRVDAVLVTSTAVIPIEFKVGATKFNQLDYEQAWDYGLDLKNFHAPSHAAPIFPILCATDAPKSDRRWKPPHADGVRPPFCCNAAGLGTAIALALALAADPGSPERKRRDLPNIGPAAAPAPITPSTWGTGSYSPTPTIIEAARALYARHTVHDITRSDAGAVNLAVTSAAVEQIIAGARERRRKAIVFVTGVPGAGKTLVGLNVATRHGSRDDAAHAVFLSGNGPLVAVLREALARDDLDRAKLTDPRARIGTSRTAVRAFIQNVHHFRDATLRDLAAPADHVVVFDEAQRAWDARQLASFMKRKKGLPGFTQTEPELLIGAMERHADWAVVVCLVGGGQEINTGEAGISAWLDGVRTLFPGWDVFISPHLTDSEYAASGALERLSGSRAGAARATFEPALHLATSMRSFRAEHLSRFVKALLDGEVELGRELFAEFRDHYPIVLTRSMRAARRWIRQQRRGTERAGLVASSSAQRLKPHAIDIRVNIDPVHWFLSPPRDTRSSLYLEDAATEFQVQGLELDWTIVTWDADLRWRGSDWSYHSFRGAKWTDVKKPERRQYLKNAYRVLLTRARQGMVIFVPPGAKRDRTRSPAFYEGIYDYLTGMGVAEV